MILSKTIFTRIWKVLNSVNCVNSPLWLTIPTPQKTKQKKTQMRNRSSKCSSHACIMAVLSENPSSSNNDKKKKNKEHTRCGNEKESLRISFDIFFCTSFFFVPLMLPLFSVFLFCFRHLIYDYEKTWLNGFFLENPKKGNRQSKQQQEKWAKICEVEIQLKWNWNKKWKLKLQREKIFHAENKKYKKKDLNENYFYFEINEVTASLFCLFCGCGMKGMRQ